MDEDGSKDGRIGEEREDLHLATTGGTEQGQHLVDALDAVTRPAAIGMAAGVWT